MRSRTNNSTGPAGAMKRLKERLLIEMVVRNRFPSKCYGFSITINLEEKTASCRRTQKRSELKAEAIANRERFLNAAALGRKNVGLRAVFENVAQTMRYWLSSTHGQRESVGRRRLLMTNPAF